MGPRNNNIPETKAGVANVYYIWVFVQQRGRRESIATSKKLVYDKGELEDV